MRLAGILTEWVKTLDPILPGTMGAHVRQTAANSPSPSPNVLRRPVCGMAQMFLRRPNVLRNGGDPLRLCQPMHSPS